MSLNTTAAARTEPEITLRCFCYLAAGCDPTSYGTDECGGWVMANPANYALIENGTAGVEEAGSDNANPETFTINHYANQIILNPTDRFEIGYLTNIQGRIIQQLSSEQIAEIDRIGTSALPSGTYLIVLCSTDQCVSRMVQIAR